MIRGKLTEEQKKILIGIINGILNYKKGSLKVIGFAMKEELNNDYCKNLEEIKSILEETEQNE